MLNASDSRRWVEIDQRDRSVVRRRVAAELDFERAIAANRDLVLFRRNAATWELLLAAMIADGAQPSGVYGLVESVRSKGLGSSALLRFVRDRRDDGLFIFGTDPKKKSKHRISVRDDLVDAVLMLLDTRNAAMQRLVHDRSPGAVGTSAGHGSDDVQRRWGRSTASDR